MCVFYRVSVEHVSVIPTTLGAERTTERTVGEERRTPREKRRVSLSVHVQSKVGRAGAMNPRSACLGLVTAIVVLASGAVFLVHGGKSDKHHDKMSNMISSNSVSQQCKPDHLTVYKVILHTYWNERLFPKHFPQWRPPAQWTKLVGTSIKK